MPGNAVLSGCRKMHLERNATWGFAFGDSCFGPFCDSLLYRETAFQIGVFTLTHAGRPFFPAYVQLWE